MTIKDVTSNWAFGIIPTLWNDKGGRLGQHLRVVAEI